MDSAEAWLSEHDPDYAETKQGWKHLDGEECDTPGQEVPFGSDTDLELLVEENEGRWLPSAQRKACERCGYLYAPNTPWQRFCTDKCKVQAFRAKNVRV
jgi:hypothetical protein